MGLARQRPDDDVAESGQAVVDPEYRGRHLFTLLKRRAAARAAEHGLYGLYSEATAAHPYSQRANVALGAVETGLLLGYIPATVEYEAIDAKPHRQSVVLYYLKTNDGHTRPVYVPPRDRAMVESIVERAGLRGTVRDAADEPATARTDVHVDDRDDHNDRVVTVRTVGGDLLDAVLVARDDALAARPTACTSTSRSPIRARNDTATACASSASRSVGSSPTACTTATCCATSTSTASRSTPATSRSRPTTDASCSTTSRRDDAAVGPVGPTLLFVEPRRFDVGGHLDRLGRRIDRGPDRGGGGAFFPFDAPVPR